MTVTWNTYNATIRCTDRLVGGIPVVPDDADRADAYESWARGQGIEDPAARHELSERLAEDTDMPVAVEDVAGLMTGFRRDDDGLYIEARQVKAMLRESAQRLGLIQKKRGARQVLQHDLHVSATDGGQKIHLDAAEPDGTDQRPISVVTRQGPRTAIKRFEYLNQPVIHCRVRVLAGGVGDGLIGEDELRDLFEFGGSLGIGADRSQAAGIFELVSLERAS